MRLNPALPLLISLCTSFTFASEMPNALSMQGFTGLINTPNAQVMNEGDIVFSYNNQFDNHLTGYDDSKERTSTEDYVFGVGLLPGFEIQGRFKEQPGYARDLSANLKYQIPQYHEYLPNIAIGAQELGGAEGGNKYENYYIVVDKSFSFLRASLGYGYGNNNKGAPRMDGVFGGLEAQVAPWASVLAEYDGEESHAGIRLTTPQEWSEHVRLNTTIASNLSDDGEVSFMVNAIFPLKRKERYLPVTVDESTPMQKSTKTKSSSKKSSTNLTEEGVMIQTLVDELIADGLNNITVLTDETTITIAYENTVYIHNELDAIGSVLRKAVKLSAYYHNFVLQPKKSNVVITSLYGSLEKADAYYTDPSYETKSTFVSTLAESKDHSVKGTLRIADANSGRYKTHLVVSPKLKTFVGTEYGAFDYQLLMGFTAYWNLYDGLDLSTRYDLPVSYSDELDPDTGIFKSSYSDGGLNSAMLNYTLDIADGLNTLSAGLYQYDYLGVMDQFIYSYDNHTVKLKLGYFEHQDYSDVTKEVYLAKYTYKYTPMDLYFEAQAGKYWYQDTGFGLSAKRFFEDVAVSINYLQTSPDESFSFSESTNKYISLAIELPLDFRKSKSNGKYAQLQGDNSWRYQQRSTVGRADGSNAIVPFSGYDPLMDLESEKYLTNRDRMNVDYIKEHAERLLDTF